jgi:glycosyltransferase involved in cell wall biosynthesis
LGRIGEVYVPHWRQLNVVKVHYYSDCYYFGGSEHMLALLLDAAEAADEFDTSLTYRWSAEYEEGLRRHVSPRLSTQPLRLPEPESLWKPLRGGARKIAKGSAYILLARQIFQSYDVARLAAIFAADKPDIVHINNGGFPAAASPNAAAVAARLARVPHVVYVANNIAVGYASPLRWPDYPLDRLVARCVSRFVTGSRAAADALSRVLRLEPGRAIAIPHGIPRRPTDKTAQEMRKRLGQEQGRTLLLVPAQLERRKGHRHLLNALHLLASNGRLDGIGTLFVGDGPEEGVLRAQVRSLGLDDHVCFVPRDSNWWNFYVASDIVVLPSIGQEDFPNVVVEAMAAARPVIGTRVAGIPEQVVDGITGIVVEPGDEPALAEAVALLVEDGERRRSFGSAGLRRYEELFTPAIAVARYRSLYRELLGDSRVP